MKTNAGSIGHRTFSTNRHTWVALAGLLLGAATLAACGPDEEEPTGCAVRVPGSSTTKADAGVTPRSDAHPADGGQPPPSTDTTALRKDGEPCTVSADCLNGSCITSYRDSDSDGYGDGKVTRCESAPARGYVLAGGDCCDSDPGTYPGVTSYSSIADACQSFDRNCDGKAERNDGSSMTCGCVGSADDRFGDGAICTACR